jgi:hypothetical protein
MPGIGRVRGWIVPWQTPDIRNPHHFLIWKNVFAQQSMSAEILAVVGHENHHRVSVHAQFFEFAHHAPDFRVDVGDHAVCLSDDFPHLLIRAAIGVILESLA